MNYKIRCPPFLLNGIYLVLSSSLGIPPLHGPPSPYLIGPIWIITHCGVLVFGHFSKRRRFGVLYVRERQQGRRKVRKSEKASTNVVGVFWPSQLNLICQNLRKIVPLKVNYRTGTINNGL